MNTLVVKLWGEEIGRLIWLPSKKECYFMLNPEYDDRPDFAPLICPKDKWNKYVPINGEREKIYQGLPSFIADSLPDYWGNKLFQQWLAINNIPSSKVSPLFKLMFIGRRGMGALEYEPAAEELEYSRDIKIADLYRLSLDVLNERESLSLKSLDRLTFENLISVGTSAGGRQMKALIALNPESGEIRSGQTDNLNGYDYYIVKFQQKDLPSSEIEMIYYEMAVGAGIQMSECRLLEIDGVNHFITRRFDRENGEKIHLQTLAAINPEATSYEDLFETAVNLELNDTELLDLFRRMVFNILGCNTDDHSKNFSFMLRKDETWTLAPAYDLTFIFNSHFTGCEPGQSLSLNGKSHRIQLDDIMQLANRFNIKGAPKIIEKIIDSLKDFSEKAKKYRLETHTASVINHAINENIRTILGSDNNRKINILLNQKGIYDVKVDSEGQTKRLFIKPSDQSYTLIDEYLLGMIDSEILLKGLGLN